MYIFICSVFIYVVISVYFGFFAFFITCLISWLFILFRLLRNLLSLLRIGTKTNPRYLLIGQSLLLLRCWNVCPGALCTQTLLLQQKFLSARIFHRINSLLVSLCIHLTFITLVFVSLFTSSHFCCFVSRYCVGNKSVSIKTVIPNKKRASIEDIPSSEVHVEIPNLDRATLTPLVMLVMVVFTIQC